MTIPRPHLKNTALAVMVAAILGAAFVQRATFNLNHLDYRNSNFVFFWLAGRMVITGENPYSSEQWLSAHDSNGVEWRPNMIFPYPLPLAVLMAPLGLMTLGQAYVWWQMVSEILIATVVWSLLGKSSTSFRARVIGTLLLVLSTLYFGPVFITLQIGGLGAISLAITALILFALERRKPLMAGLAASLLVLKPPQGLPLLLLLGVWLIARAEWRGLIGAATGTLILLGVGVLLDPFWPLKFATASQAVAERTVGLQSNILSLARIACGAAACAWWAGGTVSVVALMGLSVYIGSSAADVPPWELLSLAIPVAFITTVYLWSYDQVSYLIPIIWNLARFMGGRRQYIIAAVYVTALVLVAFAGMVVQAYTKSDLVGLATTLAVAVPTWIMHRSGRQPSLALSPSGGR